MEKAVYVYKGVVEPSNKKPTREDTNHDGLIRKMRGESASSNTYSNTSKSAVKRRKCMQIIQIID